MNVFSQFFWLFFTLLLTYILNKNKGFIVVISSAVYIAIIVDYLFFMSTIQLTDFFGISYQLLDMYMVVLLLTLLIDYFKNPIFKINFSNVLFCFFLILLGLSLILGIKQYGFNFKVVGDVRSFGIFCITILWAQRFFKLSYLKKYQLFIHGTMIFTLIYSLIVWGLDIGLNYHPFISQLQGTWSDGGSTLRFIGASEVLVISFYALYLSNSSIESKGILDIKSIIFIFIVVIFQHRSVWLAFGSGFIYILLHEFIINKKGIKLIVELIALGIFAFFALLAFDSSLLNNIANSIMTVFNYSKGIDTENTTLDTRTNVWKAVIDDLSGVNLLIGRPFGYGYAESIGWQTSPHSGYIRIIGRTGLIGLSALLMSIFVDIISLLKQNRLVVALLISIFVYMYSYDFTWVCGLIIGSCLKLANNHLNKYYILDLKSILNFQKQ